MKLRFPKGDTHFHSDAWDTYQLTQYRQAVKATRNRGVAIDCGAHAGIMTRRLCEDFKNVHAFEPVHSQVLQQNTEDYRNLTIWEYAVFSSPGSAKMHIRTDNSGDCSLSTDGVEIETRTIDSFAFDTVDFIKMDIQGAELPALIGATETILECHPTLMIEIEPDDSNRSQIQDLLQDWDYSLKYTKNADWIYVWNGWRYC
jgi:FkbM family methyltransferase